MKHAMNEKTGDEMRYCATCGHQNPAGVDSCLNCGAALAVTCPVCEQPATVGSKFCPHCGAGLDVSEQQAPPQAVARAGQVRQNLRALMPTALAQKISAAAGEILGEQREVTVLYASIANLSDPKQRLDDEDSYVLMDRALRLLGEVIYKYEGTIDKFTGDGLIALFGAPVAHENDAERAVRAGLEMLSLIAASEFDIADQPDVTLQLRVGVNTGTVIAGKVGNDLHMEYTVIGETVNLAYHLQLLADPATILVSPETYQRTRALFEYNTLPSLRMEWRTEPIRAFQALELRAERDQIERFLGLQVPLIGRATDLSRLHAAVNAAQETGNSRIISVTGEAGIGKSRLMAEFRASLHRNGVQVYQGNCLTYAHQQPLWIVAEIMRDLIGLSNDETDAVGLEKLRIYLERRKLAQKEVAWYLAHLLGLLSEGSRVRRELDFLDPAMLQRQTHSAVRQVLITEARQRATVLIFEDLHWIDPASRDFLIYLAETIEVEPLVVVLISRDVERETTLRPLFEALAQLPERVVDLQLEALSPPDGGELVDRLIAQTTTDAWLLKQQIVARANGNPLYIEEIVRALIDRGGLVRAAERGAWQVTPQVGDLLKTVPGNVKGLLMARFDRLPESLRWILQKAAVVGLSFPVSLLEQITRGQADPLASQLAQLEQRHFIEARPFRSQSGFSFRHALLQETIYSTLLKRDRGRIHAQIAQSIEESDLWLSEERAEALAHHYSRSTSPAKALPHLLVSAEKAARRCAFEPAIEFYRRALPLLPADGSERDPRYDQLQLGLGRTLKFISDYDEAGQILTALVDRLQPAGGQTGQLSLLIESLLELADVRQREGDYEQALSYLEAGRQILAQNDLVAEANLRRALLDRMAWVHFREGQLAEALSLAEQATAELEGAEQEDPIRLAGLFNTMGGIAWQQGRVPEAVSYVQHSLDLYETVGYSWGVANAYNNLGILFYVLGNWPKAVDYYERSYNFQQLIGNPEGQAFSLHNLGMLHVAMGDHDAARRELETTLAIRQRIGDTWGTAHTYLPLAHMALAQGRFAEAAEYARQAQAQVAELNIVDIQVPARWIQALVLAEEGDIAAGLRLAEEALSEAREDQFLEGEVDVLRVLGVLHARSGRYNEAETSLQQSAEKALTRNASYQHGRALQELGLLYRQLAEIEIESKPERPWLELARTTLSQAEAIFGQLEATRHLEKVRAALAEV